MPTRVESRAALAGKSQCGQVLVQRLPDAQASGLNRQSNSFKVTAKAEEIILLSVATVS
jgi:hypothetical protein